MLTLYYAPGACSFAAHIVLEELGDNFEAVKLDLAAGDQTKPDYLKVNRHGRVPALATEEGVLTQSPAILAYLADRKPELGLLPTGAFPRGAAAARMSWLSSHLHVAFAHAWRPRRFTDDAGADEGMKAKAVETVKAGLKELDEAAGDGWMFGAYSVVDPYVLVMRRWGARLGVDMGAYPALVAHGDRVAARPAAQRAIAREGIRIDA